MKLFFNPETGKFIDITAPEPTELVYHYSPIIDEQTHPERYNMTGNDDFYQIAPYQLKVGKVPIDILKPETVDTMQKAITDESSFALGLDKGILDGTISGARDYMNQMRNESWSFLLGYEYGILLACYAQQSRN
jgi:hypothetical protein